MEKFISIKKNIYNGKVRDKENLLTDLEKAYERVLRQLIWQTSKEVTMMGFIGNIRSQP